MPIHDQWCRCRQCKPPFPPTPLDGGRPADRARRARALMSATPLVIGGVLLGLMLSAAIHL